MLLLAIQEQINSYQSDPDVILMLEFQKGNTASFEALMRKYYRRILNFIYRFVNNRQIAEDLTQDVFMKVYKNAASYSVKSKFQTWIFTIAKNVSLNEVRRYEKKNVSLDQTFTDENGGVMTRQIAGPQSVVDQEMMKKERLQAIRTAIQALPKNQRIAVILRRYEDFSYEEIAKAMNTSLQAVKSLLSRAKINLKDMLKNIE